LPVTTLKTRKKCPFLGKGPVFPQGKGISPKGDVVSSKGDVASSKGKMESSGRKLESFERKMPSPKGKKTVSSETFHGRLQRGVNRVARQDEPRGAGGEVDDLPAVADERQEFLREAEAGGVDEEIKLRRGKLG
jgi:hypothetical protein